MRIVASVLHTRAVHIGAQAFLQLMSRLAAGNHFFQSSLPNILPHLNSDGKTNSTAKADKSGYSAMLVQFLCIGKPTVLGAAL